MEQNRDLNMEDLLGRYSELMRTIREVVDEMEEASENIQRRIQLACRLENLNLQISMNLRMQERIILYEENRCYVQKPILTYANPSKRTEPIECPVCYESHEHPKQLTLNCEHKYCVSCISSHLTASRENVIPFCCPMCRQKIQRIELNAQESDSITELIAELERN